tara:strand:+ start:1770 stop:1970 length:201 start_codon:yes stop_codon:yes gene_type:complete
VQPHERLSLAHLQPFLVVNTLFRFFGDTLFRFFGDTLFRFFGEAFFNIFFLGINKLYYKKIFVDYK